MFHNIFTSYLCLPMDESQKVTLDAIQLSYAENGQKNEDLSIETLQQMIEKRLITFSNEIRDDTKMHAYLQDINIAPAELLLSYDTIIKTNKHLSAQAKDNPIVAHGVKSYLQFVHTFLTDKPTDTLDSKGKIGWYIEVQTKLTFCSAEMFTSFKTERDITNSPKEQYSKVWEKITFVKAEDIQLIKKQYKDLKRMLHNAVSSTLNEAQHENTVMQKLRFGLSFAKYLIMNDSSKIRSFKFYRAPTLQQAQIIWNMGENGATKHLSKLRFDSVTSKIKMYLPIEGQLDPAIDIFQPRENAIIIRVLSSTPLVKYPQRQQQPGCCFCSSKKQVVWMDSAIFHIHGGGFISLSSRTMQIYTRKWTNELNVPVFSVDYRMPPNHPFPFAPNDCFKAYRFIVHNIHKYLNIRPTKVYVAGDSAGGNIASSLVGLILKHKEPIPQALYLTYPAMDLRKTFTTSRIYSIIDIFLWPGLLMLCLKSYLNNDLEKANDPLASPLLLTQEYVGGEKGDTRFPLKWPRTLIDVGTRDPLLDDSLLMMQKMVQSGIPCECILYEGFSHGFFNTGAMIKQTNKTIVNSITNWKKLMLESEKH